MLDAALADARIELDAAARAAVDAHVRLLTAWNAQINLTALRTPASVARGHVLDSLIPAATLGELGGDSLLDLGSGAGFPGLPLAAHLPLRRVALVDSIGKKARFLAAAAREVAAALAQRTGPSDPPQIAAVAERAEDLADERDQREAWDLVVARAVGTLAEVAELGLPLAKRGGHVVAWKRDAGDGALQHEVQAAARICHGAGGGAARIVRLAAADMPSAGLPGHCLVVIEKRRPTPDRYPRPAGERRRAP